MSSGILLHSAWVTLQFIGYYNDNPNDIFETMDDVLLAISEFP